MFRVAPIIRTVIASFIYRWFEEQPLQRPANRNGRAVSAQEERVLLFLRSWVSLVIDTGEVLKIEVSVDLSG